MRVKMTIVLDIDGLENMSDADMHPGLFDTYMKYVSVTYINDLVKMVFISIHSIQV